LQQATVDAYAEYGINIILLLQNFTAAAFAHLIYALFVSPCLPNQGCHTRGGIANNVAPVFKQGCCLIRDMVSLLVLLDGPGSHLSRPVHPHPPVSTACPVSSLLPVGVQVQHINTSSAADTATAGIAVLLDGLLAAAARKKSSYRAAALAALQKVLSALQPLTRTSAGTAVVDGSIVWSTVSAPLLEALQQHLASASTPLPAAKEQSAGDGSGAGGAEQSDEVKPLPLPETCRQVLCIWLIAHA
jgi:hypothetical protein